MAVSRVIGVLVIILSLGEIFADVGPVAASPVDVPLNFAEEIKVLRTLLGTIETRVINLQTTVEQLPPPGNLQQCRVQSVTEAIRAGKYVVAAEKLVELKSDKMIPVIVQEVFANSSKNADAILAFAKAQKIAETKVLVIKALLEEMRERDQCDPLVLISIVKQVHRQLRTNDKNVREKAQTLIEDIVEEIKTGSISKFTNAMTSNTFNTDAEVAKLADVLFYFRLDVFNEVMEEVIDKVLPIAGTKAVVENIGSLKHIQQIIPALTMVFTRVAGNLTIEDELALASQIQSLQKRDNYETINMFLKIDVDEMIKQFAPSVSNLFFAKSVCLWNKGMKMYLYATDVEPSDFTEWRTTHLTASKPGPAATWNIEQKGADYVYFRNILYSSEYLSPRGETNEDNKRYVWVGEEFDRNESKWAIEFVDKHCYIMSSHFKEYLVASDEYEKSEAFTFETNKDIRSEPYYHWELRNCDHVEA